MPDEKVTELGVPEAKTKATRIKAVREKEKRGEVLTDEEREFLDAEREANRLKVAEHRKYKSQSDSSRRYNNGTELSKKSAREVLSEAWGLQNPNPHAVNTIVDLGENAADHFRLTRNQHLYRHGLRATLRANEIGGPVTRPEIEDGAVTGELLSRRELYLIWDFSMFRQPEVTFEDFLDMRHKAKTDCYFLGNTILGKDFTDCHKVWTDFFPTFNPDTLKPNYTQREAIAWLSQQADTKNYLMLASRGSFKSSWSHVWILTLILCLPDARVLLVSETRPLSKDFIGAIRSYFEKTPGEDSKFRSLFPEYAIPIGDGSMLSLDCPMAHLRLPQSIESTSMDSSVAGRRADLILFDDCISSTSCGNETQIAASVAKYDMLTKLRQVGGYVAVLGTPWAAADLYAVLIKRNEDNEDKPLAFRIDPAWTIKEQAKEKALRDLQEDDVVLLAPAALPWKHLQAELRNNEEFFKSQNLMIFPLPESEEFTVNFSEDVLRAHIRPGSFFDNCPLRAKIMAIDVGLSVSARADRSAIAVVECRLKEATSIGVVRNLNFGRWKQSELAIQIVQDIQRFQPERVIIERTGAHESLWEQIGRAAMLRAVPLPYFHWVVTNAGSQSQMNKASRIKSLEGPLADAQFWLCSSAQWNDFLIDEMVRYKGKKSNAYTKEDAIDAVERAFRAAVPRTSYEVEKAVEDTAEIERERRAAAMRAMHSRMFSGDAPPPRAPDPEPQRPSDPRLQWLPRGMRL